MRGLVAGAVVAGGLAVAFAASRGEAYAAFRLVASPHSDAPSGWMPAPSGTATPSMSVLRNLEDKIAGLVEGTFGRVFRSEVRPVEIARKLAREMDEHRTVSVSRTYVPNEYVVWLSPEDRAALRGRRARGHRRARRLPARARPPRAARARQPPADQFAPTSACARRVRHPGAARARRRARGASSRPTTATRWSTRPRRARRRSCTSARSARRGRAMLVAEGKRYADRPGRRRRSGAAASATSSWPTPTSRAATPSCGPLGDGWTITDLGSTNGVRVNGRDVRANEPQPAAARRPDRGRHRRRALRGRLMPPCSSRSPSA